MTNSLNSSSLELNHWKLTFTFIQLPSPVKFNGPVFAPFTRIAHQTGMFEPDSITSTKVSLISRGHTIQCVPEKRKPVNQVNFSENCNDLSETVYIVTKFSLFSFFLHQLQDVLVMHGQARTISNGDVKIDLRRIGI